MVRNNLVYELEENNYQHSQSHLPIREQTEPVGHAVKAMYYYTAAVDKARLNDDKELFVHMCDLWQSVVSQKMYLTGAIGACAYGESFSYPYDLPTDLMYGETCAAIGLFLLSYHMLLVETDSRYSDIMERTLYNAILVGMSESGTEFFYTNALEIDPKKCEKRQDYSHLKSKRQTWFDCPCCPPNIARLLMGMNKYIYTGDRNELNVHLFIGSSIQKDGWEVQQETVYPDNGKVRFRVKRDDSEKGVFRVRIPDWCNHYNVSMDGEQLNVTIRKGYLEIAKEEWSKESILEINFDMQPQKVYGSLKVSSLTGKTAVAYGPLVYCAEEADNQDLHTLYIKRDGKMRYEDGRLIVDGYRAIERNDGLYGGKAPDYEEARLCLVPYYSWGNRSKGAMTVFLKER